MTGLAGEGSNKSSIVLIVRLGRDFHAIPIEVIAEVLPALPIEPIPQCPKFVLGVIFVRGHLIPVLDAAERLSLPEHKREQDPHIVCVRIKDRLVGLEVDEAIDLLELQDSQELLTEEIGSNSGFVRSVLDHQGTTIRLLDVARMMDRGEMAQLKPIPQTAHG